MRTLTGLWLSCLFAMTTAHAQVITIFNLSTDESKTQIYQGREKRDSLVDGKTMRQLQEMERELVQPGWAAMQLDKQASALWLSSRLNRPVEEVMANFDPYARNYFGRVITPAAVYDEIVKYEYDQAAMASQPAIAATQKADKPEGGMSEVEAALKPGQFIRTAGGAFEKAGHDMAAGMFSIIERVLKSMGETPERKGVSEDEDYTEAIQKLDRLERNRLGNTAEAEKLRAIADKKGKEFDDEFTARKQEYEKGTWRGSLALKARGHAAFFYALGGDSIYRYGSASPYLQTTNGKVSGFLGKGMAWLAVAGAGWVLLRRVICRIMKSKTVAQ